MGERKNMSIKKDWKIYKGTNVTDKEAIKNLPDAPPWRKKDEELCKTFKPYPEEIDLVNAALYLRRPLLITGKPGVGKTALAKAIACELDLGEVLSWHITTQSTLKDALYSYDAVARLHDASLNKGFFKKTSDENIGKYISLGALGTAFKSDTIRVVLIDEIDKSDVDLPNNLLHVLEENRFSIPELERSDISKHYVKTHDWEDKDKKRKKEVEIVDGKIEVDPNKFPLIIMTSNGEREFPPAFMRRCLHLTMHPRRGIEELEKIVKRHITLTDDEMSKFDKLIKEFDNQSTDENYIPVDKLLNSLFLKLKGVDDIEKNEKLLSSIWKALSV
jgi:MoxR-like ATPase